jgi:uncharacterized protein YdeI (YjbR/CyaY-like superfamily)
MQYGPGRNKGDHKGLPVLAFARQDDWDTWLAAHGASSGGLWIKIAKAGAEVATVGKAEAIDTALVHGWIDGQIDRFDDRFWLTRFTPRGPKSKWSQNNCATAERLIAANRMHPAGLIAVEAAKADGRWAAAYAPQSRAEVPDDLAKALDATPKAKAFFATLKGANRYAVLYRIHDAKTAKTRAARIDIFVAMLARGEVLHPPKT